MKAFKFRLARVQRAYEINEELARGLWLAAVQRTTEARAQLQRLEDAYKLCQVQLSAGLQSGGISPHAAVLAHKGMDEQERRISASRERIQTLLFQEEQLREPWEEKRQLVRGLEQLSERSKARHNLEQLQLETKELDEVASGRAAKARRLANSKPGSSPDRVEADEYAGLHADSGAEADSSTGHPNE